MKKALNRLWTSRDIGRRFFAALFLVGLVSVSLFQGSAAAVTCQPPYTTNPDTNRCECNPPYAISSVTGKCQQAPTQPSGGATTDGGGGAASGDACTRAATDPKTKVTCIKPNGQETDPALKSGNCANASKCDIISNYINPAVNFLTAFVGIGVTIAIVYGGIEYGSSGGDPARAAAGKNRIRNAIFTLVVYFFLYALLNFLMPGGVNS